MSRNYVADDYDTIRQNMFKLNPPPFVSGNAAPGTHCSYCVRADSEHCPDPCSKAYENKYGIEPKRD